MSDFLAAEGIPALSGYRAEHITARPRPRRRRQRDLARQPRARRSARPQDPLLLAAGGDPRALSLGRALDRHRRHARQDHDHVADRLAADRTAASIRACWSAASRATSASTARATGSGSGREFVIEGDEYDSAFFDKTAKFLKYLPDIAVDQQRRVRSRRHLRRPRRGHAGVPPAGQPGAAPRPAAPRRRQRRRARR